jgi:hypothetical protein
MVTDFQISQPEKYTWIRSMLPPVLLLALLVAVLPKAVQWRREPFQ